MTTRQLTQSPPTAAPGVQETLERCRLLTAPALRRAVDRLTPSVGRMASFALGWCDADGTPRRGGGGKGLRPALALLSAQAVGGDAADAVPAAVAVELVHVFSLVHDDIMDGDEHRRHRPAAWKAFGVGPAVLAGDALLALAAEALASAEAATAGVRMLAAALVDLVNGQAEDVSFEARPWSGPRAVTAEEYTAMADRKTGALLGCAAGLGALLAGAPPEAVTELSRMGRHLGLAFQAVDDLLGIWGDPAVTGKPVRSDLRRRKKTLPVVAALAAGGPASRRLAGILAGSAGPRALREAAGIIDASGGRAHASAAALHHIGAARQIIDRTAVDRDAADALAELTEFAVHRSH